MKWKKFTLKTTTEAVDYISSLFDEIGIEGIEIEDNVPLTEQETKGMFIDILPELPPDDGTAKVSFYLDDDAIVEDYHQTRWTRDWTSCASICEIWEQRTITASETEDKDWINNWKQYFKPFTVDRHPDQAHLGGRSRRSTRTSLLVADRPGNGLWNRNA